MTGRADLPGSLPAASRPPRGRGGPGERGLRGYARAALIVAATTVVAVGAHRLRIPDVDALFVLGVMLSALTAGRGPALLATVLAVLAYDFLIIPPEFVVTLVDGRFLVSFATLLGVSLIVGSLTLRLREQQRAALERERSTAALHALTSALAAAADEATVAVAVERAAALATGAEALLVVVGPERVRGLAAPERAGALSDAERELVRVAARTDRATSGGGGLDAAAPGPARVRCLPVQPFAEGQAVLVTRPGAPGEPGELLAFVEAIARSAAVALDRVRLAAEARREELRTGLLSSVSHDLRTPLASITGAATALRQDEALDADTRRELIDSIVSEAERLERLVSNLLDMTRLEQGAVTVQREWVPAEEVVGSALTRLERRLSGHLVHVTVAPDLPLLSVDPVLLEQLLVNLLENAAKYTPPGSEIAVSATLEGAEVVLEVADRGPGLPPGEEERIFERFHRGPRAGASGTGLGLAIARAIAQVHGGRLSAQNREGGGARFRLAVPLPADGPPGVARAADDALGGEG